MTSTAANENLFVKAEIAAKRAASDWIRATFRESFLQALKQAWVVQEPSAENEEYTVKISSEGLEECISLVQTVSEVWQSKLEEAQHDRVAEWVRDIFYEGQSTFWDADCNSDAPSSATDTEDAAATTAITVEEGNSDQLSLSPNNNDTQPSHIEPPYCKLRKLGRKRFLDDKLANNPLEIFQEMGEKGHSYWPLDWKLIEEAAKNLQKRLPSKRRSLKQPPAKRQKQIEISRPPSDLSLLPSSAVSLSKEETDRLDQYIHPGEEKQACTLLGPLLKVGSIHVSKRLKDKQNETLARREIAGALHERIYPNRILNANKRRHRSKIFRTADRDHEEEQCLDVDLGWTMMEVLDTTPDSDGQKRRLCAFSSIEMRLLDQDKKTSQQLPVAFSSQDSTTNERINAGTG